MLPMHFQFPDAAAGVPATAGLVCLGVGGLCLCPCLPPFELPPRACLEKMEGIDLATRLESDRKLG